MKQYHTNSVNTKAAHLGFYLVLGLCIAMIAVSCWFAYTQTADNIASELNSAIEKTLEPPVRSFSGLERETALPTERPTESRPVSVNSHAEEAVQAPIQETALMETEPAVPETEAETASSERRMQTPVGGKLLAPFSNGELVKSQTTGIWQTHNGVDISCETGADIAAAASGIVCDVTDDPLWGICVTIDHQNTVCTRYCGLDANLDVSVGDAVEAGMVIGRAGNSVEVENAMEPHIHFEVIQDGHYLDPVICARMAQH